MALNLQMTLRKLGLGPEPAEKREFLQTATDLNRWQSLFRNCLKRRLYDTKGRFSLK